MSEDFLENLQHNKKKKATYSISEVLLNDFDILSKELKIKKSVLIEALLKEFIKNNKN